MSDEWGELTARIRRTRPRKAHIFARGLPFVTCMCAWTDR